jgi:hypothetical protein
MKLLLFLLPIFVAGRINAQDLDDFRWKNRIVLLFASAEGKSVFTRQVEELKLDPEGLAERDLIIFLVSREQVTNLLSEISTSLSSERLTEKYFREDEKFQFILIGKDGGVKLDRSEFVSNDYLYAVIDAMPMRRQEMQRNKNE